jgi:hypothetical protein
VIDRRRTSNVFSRHAPVGLARLADRVIGDLKSRLGGTTCQLVAVAVSAYEYEELVRSPPVKITDQVA